VKLRSIAFWGDGAKCEILANAQPARLHAALPKRLGHLPFWRSEKDFVNESLTWKAILGSTDFC